MKKNRVLFLVLSLVILGGCQPQSKKMNTENNDANKESSTETNLSSVVAEYLDSEDSKMTSKNDSSEDTVESLSSEKKQHSDVRSTLWNSDKAQQLQAFMSSWGNTMGQQYKEYKVGNSVNYYGIMVPDRLLDGEIEFKVDGQAATLGWSETGTGSSDFELVAVYSDSESSKNDQHCYLFTIQNDLPRVLIGQSKGFYETWSIPFEDTANQELKTGFAQIVTSDDSVKTSIAETNEADPISYEEGKRLLKKADIIFSDQSGNLVTEIPDFDFTKGGNHVATANGGMILRQYSGARGFEEYTVTPLEDNQVHIVWETSSINNGERTNREIAKDVIIPK